MGSATLASVWRSFTLTSIGFSAKTFGAAVLALYVAFRLDLDQPSWALTTVYVVAQPYAGMVMAKSFYRLIGTVLGAVVSLLLVALFSDAPELFCVALALWIGVSTFLSIYLRDEPQAYAAVLSGYSAAIIGLPAALAPDTAFEFATARCLEIAIGIACGTLAHHLVFPQKAGPELLRRIESTLPALARWARDALSGEAMTPEAAADRRRIIAAVVGLDALRVYAILDTPALRAINPLIRQIEGRLLSMLALLVSVSDRLIMLRRDDPDVADALRPALDARVARLSGDAADSSTASAIAPPAPDGGMSATSAFLVRSILVRCDDMVRLWDETSDLQRRLADPSTEVRGQQEIAVRRYRDPRLALIGGAISCLSILVSSAFWIATAWPNGTTAVTFAGVICAIMAARDNPTAISRNWLHVTLFAGVLSSVGVLAILPQASAFETLVAAIAPFYLVTGALLTSPSLAGLAMPAIFVCSALMNLSNHMTLDFAAMLNALAGIFIGILIAHVLLGVFRPIGTEWFVARLTAGVRQDLVAMARNEAVTPASRTAFESRMFDRINALLSRLPGEEGAQRELVDGALASLRVGLNLLVLNRSRATLSSEVAAPVRQAVAALAAHLESLSERSARHALTALAHAARSIEQSGRDDLRPVLDALLGVSTTLRQHAAFFGVEAEIATALTEAAA